MRELQWMAEGAYMPHAQSDALFVMANSGGKQQKPSDYNPFTKAMNGEDKGNLESGVGFMMMKSLANKSPNDHKWKRGQS